MYAFLIFFSDNCSQTFLYDFDILVFFKFSLGNCDGSSISDEREDCRGIINFLSNSILVSLFYHKNMIYIGVGYIPYK